MKQLQSLRFRAIDQGNPNSLSARLRRKRGRLLLKLIEREAERNGSVSIIDLGGERGYWNFLPADVMRQHRVHISLVNLPGRARGNNDEFFDYVEGDACNLRQFASGSFAIAHSNSVIEHVGSWENMRAFAEEVRRLGRMYFVQTPNFWFPVEPHFMMPFFHWCPHPVRAALLTRFELGTWPRAGSIGEAMRWVEHATLLDRKMFSHLFADGQVHTERFFGLPKSLIAVRD